MESRLRALLARDSVRYLLVGGLCFLVDVGLLALLNQVFHWPIWWATGVAFVASFFFTFFVQRVLAFRSQAPHGWSLLKYAALVAFNTLAITGIVTLFAPLPVGWLIGKVVSTAITTVWNYFAYRYWVFAHPRRKG
jgi:putative flippase GtrA